MAGRERPSSQAASIKPMNKADGSAVDKQARADSLLNQAFENSAGEATGGTAFDYRLSSDALGSEKPWEKEEAMVYLRRMQRAGLTQPHGVMLVVEPGGKALRLIAYSENAPNMFDVPAEAIKLGMDVCGLFEAESASMLRKEVADQLDSKQPIAVQLRDTQTQFYAILSACEAGYIVDLEPVKPKPDQTLSVAGTKNRTAFAQGKHPAVVAAERLNRFPGGDLIALCEAVVQELRQLTGYDRIMAYKFHEDEHGEVLAESVREGLEPPYLGLHFPATDIPQAMRTLFMRIGCRMICNAGRPMVKVTQSEELSEGINLSDSTLRAPHGCHAKYMVNMNSAASLTLAVLVNQKKDELDPNEELQPSNKKLWGLIVCHHCTPRYTPYPLRKGLEFVVKSFQELLNREVLMAAIAHEEAILRTQTQLCDMLEHDVPLGIVRETPNIMDLVKCDGAALFYAGRFWLLGVTPTEKQIKAITDWLMQAHKRKKGVRTESLADAGFPLATELGDAVCGMVAAKIRERDWVLWFRSHTAKEVRWAGAKAGKGEVDDPRRMHPRNSFTAFLDVVRKRSLPWEAVEMDAISSLQLMLNGSLENMHSHSPAQTMEGMGGTTEDGTPASGGTTFKIRPKEEPATPLEADVEEALSKFQSTFYVTDATREDRPVIFASGSFCAMAGYSAAELRGASSINLLKGADTDEHELEKLASAVSRGSQHSCRLLSVRKDGTAFWNLVTIAPVRNSYGYVTNHVMLNAEVAKLSNLETPTPQTLSLSPQLTQQLKKGGQKTFPTTLIRYDARQKDQSHRTVREIVEAIKFPMRGQQQPAGEKEGLSLNMLKDLPAAAEQAAPRESTRRKSFVARFILGEHKGEPAAAAAPEAPADAMDMMESPSGQGGRDTKKRRGANKGIDMGTTLERIDSSFVIMDARTEEHPIIFASDGLTMLTGYQREELIGANMQLLVGSATEESEMDKVKQAMEAEQDLTAHFLCYMKEGEKFWIVFHMKVVKDWESQLQYFIGIIQGAGATQLSADDLRKASAKAEATSTAVFEALKDLADTAVADKLWAIHNKPVKAKPHSYQDVAWAAIRQAQEVHGRLGVKHFRPIKPLGMGDSGSVYLVELRATGQLFAMKIMEKEAMIERNKVHRVAAEREILDTMDHPFCPTLYASFQTAKHVCLITDFCAGGELYSVMDRQPGHRFKEDVARFYAAEVLLALEYLHCKGVVYRDLKPENILVSQSGHLLLTDFDLSVLNEAFPKIVRPKEQKKRRRGGFSFRQVEEALPLFIAEPLARSNSFVGTEEYIAPEVVKGTGHSGAVDWWGLGILLYEMLYGRTPFCGKTVRRTFENVLTKRVPFPATPQVSEDAKDIIRRLLLRDPEQRLGGQIGAAEIKAHPFFNSINWPLIRAKAGPAPDVLPPKIKDELKAETANGTGAVGEGPDSWALGGRPSSDASSSARNLSSVFSDTSSVQSMPKM